MPGVLIPIAVRMPLPGQASALFSGLEAATWPSGAPLTLTYPANKGVTLLFDILDPDSCEGLHGYTMGSRKEYVWKLREVIEFVQASRSGVDKIFFWRAR